MSVFEDFEALIDSSQGNGENAEMQLRYEQEQELQRREQEQSSSDLLTLTYILNNKMDMLIQTMTTLTSRLDTKHLKKQRSEFNRCGYRNRKGEPCRSYVTKRSKFLCHAHLALTTRSAPYLYGQQQ